MQEQSVPQAGCFDSRVNYTVFFRGSAESIDTMGQALTNDLGSVSGTLGFPIFPLILLEWCRLLYMQLCNFLIDREYVPDPFGIVVGMGSWSLWLGGFIIQLEASSNSSLYLNRNRLRLPMQHACTLVRVCQQAEMIMMTIVGQPCGSQLYCSEPNGII